MDLTILAYATLGLSLFVSAVKMGGWILHADPRTILNGGRWALVAFAALALGVLIMARDDRPVVLGHDACGLHAADICAGRTALAGFVWPSQCHAKRLSSHHTGF